MGKEKLCTLRVENYLYIFPLFFKKKELGRWDEVRWRDGWRKRGARERREMEGKVMKMRRVWV